MGIITKSKTMLILPHVEINNLMHRGTTLTSHIPQGMYNIIKLCISFFFAENQILVFSVITKLSEFIPFRSTLIQWGSCYSIFSFMCMFCRSLFVLFLSAIVVSVLLRFTDSEYTFGIFKLFLCYLFHFFNKIFTNNNSNGLS